MWSLLFKVFSAVSLSSTSDTHRYRLLYQLAQFPCIKCFLKYTWWALITSLFRRDSSGEPDARRAGQLLLARAPARCFPTFLQGPFSSEAAELHCTQGSTGRMGRQLPEMPPPAQHPALHRALTPRLPSARGAAAAESQLFKLDLPGNQRNLTMILNQEITG